MADPVETGALAPINGTAARVVAKAGEQNLWRPMPKASPMHTLSHVPIPTAPLPKAAPRELLALIGRRRDRMTIFGYAKDQGSKKQHARWVVRCDCGNYEVRRNILRWLGTEAPDLCAECHNRKYLLSKPDQGMRAAKEPAKRSAVALGGEHA